MDHKALYRDMAPVFASLFGKPTVEETPTGYTHTWTFEPIEFVPFNPLVAYIPQRQSLRNAYKALAAILDHMRDNGTRDARIGKHRVRIEKRRGRTYVKAG